MYHKNFHFHFIGIGGIGMSALAIILKQRGYHVTGSDYNLEQKSVQYLQVLGCTIYDSSDTIGCLSLMPDVVIYSAAIRPNNIEFIAAQQRNIPLISRAQLLADLFNKQEGVAIAGAHGKTTTSALISHIFMQAGYDPTYAVGGHLHNYHTNARHGLGKYFIAETCENDHTIELVRPSIAVLTNVDREHLDVYNNLEDIKKSFLTYLNNVTFYGKIILCLDDPHAASLINRLTPHMRKRIITYGFSSQADIFVQHYDLTPTAINATIRAQNNIFGNFTLAIPGKHNLLNSLAAWAVCKEVNIPFTEFAQACKNFLGVDRRFTRKGFYKGATIYDDYGHHPTEIEKVIPVAYHQAQQQGGRLIILFQPHRFSRTEKLWPEFLEVFSKAPFDELVITDIYPAFEDPIEEVNSRRLVEELQNINHTKQVLYVPEAKNFSNIHQFLEHAVQKNDLILFLGAGKINMLADQLIQDSTIKLS
jgi:UDP-N-acetylmuramate--alanine ligase